jgi:hypothetical protein
MQAATVARLRIASLKQTGSVQAYANLFQKELTPITDMSAADQVFFFRQGLKPHNGQRVLEKMPQTLHAAMDLALLADVNGRVLQSGSHHQGNRSHGQSSYRSQSGSSSSQVAMDVSNVNQSEDGENFESPVFHEEKPEESPSDRVQHQMVSLMEKLVGQQQSINALFAAVGSGGSKGGVGDRVPQVSKEEFDRCFKNRLCLKCKKPGHIARNCRSGLKH